LGFRHCFFILFIRCFNKKNYNYAKVNKKYKERKKENAQERKIFWKKKKKMKKK